tara:strand:+ start:72 stop:1106 length:1035 start_codon:yes stop_codon:yes gene_type:complete
MSKKKLNIAIIGATGYTGLDLVFLLSKHPNVKICYLCATKSLGKKINFFDKRIKKKLPNISSINSIKWSHLDLVFLSLPNGQAQKIIKKKYFQYNKIKFIDLSADFRLTNPRVYNNTYNINHNAKNLIKKSIYSLSEIVKTKIKSKRIIANPGCYPTSVQIPLIPLLKKNLIHNKNIIIDAKSGFSGAGKNLEKKFKHRNLYFSTYAYSIKKHRHIAEIEQELLKNTKKKVFLTFIPHLIPTFRGILSTIYVDLKKLTTVNKIRNELIKYYKKDKFIKILKLNSELGSGNVINTNNCEISICSTRNKKKVVILCAIDNLIKGASGQAIQNMNLIYGYSQSLGLK